MTAFVHRNTHPAPLNPCLNLDQLCNGESYATVKAAVHAKWSTPYFTDCPIMTGTRIGAGVQEGKTRPPYFAAGRSQITQGKRYHFSLKMTPHPTPAQKNGMIAS